MYIEDRINEAIGNFTDTDVMTFKKVSLELSYNDLIKISIALNSQEAVNDLLIKSYEENN